jgi:hypothetical protein
MKPWRPRQRVIGIGLSPMGVRERWRRRFLQWYRVDWETAHTETRWIRATSARTARRKARKGHYLAVSPDRSSDLGRVARAEGRGRGGSPEPNDVERAQERLGMERWKEINREGTP